MGAKGERKDCYMFVSIEFDIIGKMKQKMDMDQ